MLNPKVNILKNKLETLYDVLRGYIYSGKQEIKLTLNKATTKEEIKSIISIIDFRCNLYFYDAYYMLEKGQQPYAYSDYGAFTEIILNKNVFYARRGNHGGYKDSGKWIPIDKVNLINTILKSKEFNMGSMSLESKEIRRQWIKEGESKVLRAYYHDITDLEEKLRDASKFTHHNL